MNILKMPAFGLLVMCAIQFADARANIYTSAFDVPSFDIQAQHMKGSYDSENNRRIYDLLQVLTPNNNGSTNSNDPQEPSQDEIAGGMQDITNLSPGEAWDKYKILNETYFTKHTLTAYDARAEKFFAEFMDAYNGTDPFKCLQGRVKLSQVQCFIRTYTGDLNWNCRIDSPHACTIATPKVIMEHVWATWLTQGPYFTIEKKTEIARKAYFALLNLREAQVYFSTTFDLLETISFWFQHKAVQLVSDFTPQSNPNPISPCKAILISAKVISAVGESVGKFIGGDPTKPSHPTMGDMIDKGGESYEKAHEMLYEAMVKWNMLKKLKRIDELRKTVGQSVTETTGLIKLFNDGIYRYSGYADRLYVNKLYPGTITSGSYDRGDGKLVQQYTTPRGFCGHVFGEFHDDNVMRTEQLKTYIIEHHNAAREELAALFEYMIHYHSGDPDNEVLRLFMGFDYSTSANAATRSYTHDKKAISDSLLSITISELSASSRCFMECNKRPDAVALCEKKAKRKWVKRSRYCPNDDTVCQISCLRKHGNYVWKDKREFFGIENLKKYNLTMENLLENSWARYDMNKNLSINSQTFMDDLGLRQSKDLLHALPVCYNSYSTVNSPNEFPFGCGATYTNEDTEEFLRAVAVQPSKEVFISLVQYPRFIKKEIKNPLTQYLTTCEVNLRWPWKGVRNILDTRTFTRGQTDPRCNLVRREIQYMDTEFEATYHFCTSQTARGVFRDEEKTIMLAGGSPSSVATKCEVWLVQNQWRWSFEGTKIREKFERFCTEYRAEKDEEERLERDRNNNIEELERED